MSVSGIGVPSQSVAYSPKPRAQDAVAGSKTPASAGGRKTYDIPGGFSFGQGITSKIQVDDPRAAFDTMTRTFQYPTLRDIVSENIGREDSKFHDRQYYESVSMMFQQMMPMFEKAAEDVVKGIRSEHAGADGQLTEEGRKALDEVLEALSTAKARVEEMRDKAATTPEKIPAEEAKLRQHQKAIKEQEERWKAFLASLGGAPLEEENADRDVDEVKGRFGFVIDALGALGERLSAARTQDVPASGGLGIDEVV